MTISVQHDVVKNHHSIMVSQVLTYHLTFYPHGSGGKHVLAGLRTPKVLLCTKDQDQVT